MAELIDPSSTWDKLNPCQQFVCRVFATQDKEGISYEKFSNLIIGLNETFDELKNMGVIVELPGQVGVRLLDPKLHVYAKKQNEIQEKKAQVEFQKNIDIINRQNVAQV